MNPYGYQEGPVLQRALIPADQPLQYYGPQMGDSSREYWECKKNELKIQQAYAMATLESQRETERSQRKVHEQFLLEQIRTEAEATREKNRADIAELRKLQREDLYRGRDGQIRIRKQCFGGTIDDILGVEIEKAVIWTNTNCRFEEILYFEIKQAGGKNIPLLFRTSDRKESEIIKNFTRSGINFGFSRRKEHEMRVKLVEWLMETSPRVELPARIGWWKKDGYWDYTFPGYLTWEEVVRYALRSHNGVNER